MIILGIDTTSTYCSVAILKDKEVLTSSVINNGNTHSEVLLPQIKESFEKTGIGVGDVDLFALSSCPGSFTGVRIGAATIKGLAFGSNKACVGVSTIEALAYNLRSVDGIVVPVMDARRNQFYNGIFRCKDGRVERLTEDRLISAQDLENELESFEESIYFTGYGYDLARKSIKNQFVEDTPEELIPQNACSVCALARKIYEESCDKSVFTDLLLKPGYLRASQAERERKEKKEKNT